MSVLDYLMPERVGTKDRTDCYPVGGEFLVDVDSYLWRRPHKHSFDNHGVCDGCLEISRQLTLEAADQVGRYYDDMAIVFSGRRGYHLHTLDFDVHDWVRYDPRDPFGSQAAARFRFLKIIEPVSHVFDRIHFTVSVDPLRIVSVPGSVNGETGLVCSFVGTPSDLERRSTRSILDESSTLMVAPIPYGR
jgi:DNA primase catalytic subunit